MNKIIDTEMMNLKDETMKMIESVGIVFQLELLKDIKGNIGELNETNKRLSEDKNLENIRTISKNEIEIDKLTNLYYAEKDNLNELCKNNSRTIQDVYNKFGIYNEEILNERKKRLKKLRKKIEELELLYEDIREFDIYTSSSIQDAHRFLNEYMKYGGQYSELSYRPPFSSSYLYLFKNYVDDLKKVVDGDL